MMMVKYYHIKKQKTTYSSKNPSFCLKKIKKITYFQKFQHIMLTYVELCCILWLAKNRERKEGNGSENDTDKEHTYFARGYDE